MGEHTPTPWHIDDKEPGELWIAYDQKVPVCMVTGSGNVTERDKADAAFIVKAVNSHEALVKALEFYADDTRYDGANHRLVGNDPYTPEDQVYRRDVTRDSGAIAREALAQVKP